MAGRPKSTASKEKADSTAKAKTTATSKENKNTEASNLEAIMKQMEAMQKELLSLKKENASLQNTASVDSNIDLDAEIEVVSQFRGTLILATEPNGQGNKYVFEEFGEVQDIPFIDLKAICKNMRRFAEEGLFYILDRDVVKKLRLDRKYSEMLDFDNMKNLEKKPSNEVLNLFKLASDLQQEEIISFYLGKYRNKETVDMNVLQGLSKIVGRDLLAE